MKLLRDTMKNQFVNRSKVLNKSKLKKVSNSKKKNKQQVRFNSIRKFLSSIGNWFIGLFRSPEIFGREIHSSVNPNHKANKKKKRLRKISQKSKRRNR